MKVFIVEERADAFEILEIEVEGSPDQIQYASPDWRVNLPTECRVTNKFYWSRHEAIVEANRIVEEADSIADRLEIKAEAARNRWSRLRYSLVDLED